MNKFLTVLSLVIVSFIILIIQTTFLSPEPGSYLFPDLNLIFIIYLAIRKDIPAAIIIVILNGYLMDAMSGYTLGVHTFSRLITYLIVRNSASKVDYENVSLQFLVFFAGTVLTWLFVWLIFKTKFSYEPVITLEVIINQATINCIVGVILTYLTDYSYAKLQK